MGESSSGATIVHILLTVGKPEFLVAGFWVIVV